MNENINKQINEYIENNPVVLFMKGTKFEPECSFSAHVVQILNAYQVPFKDVNVLEDWDMREGIKAYTNWATIPQLYVKGEFIGGHDITLNLHRKGELESILAEVPKNES